MMLSKNKEAMIHSPDGETVLNFVSGILQGDTLAP